MIRAARLIGPFALLALATGTLSQRTEAAPTDEPRGALRTAAAIIEQHERALIRDLLDYAAAEPTAADRDQAYLTVFELVIKNDWFGDHEAAASDYLAKQPDGAVRPLAQVVRTMALAQRGRFDEAAAGFDELLAGMGTEQRDFAVSLGEQLAGQATAAGASGVARRVYEALLLKFGGDAEVVELVRGEQARLDLTGKPFAWPAISDVAGKLVPSDTLRGKVVLIDFWASYCLPWQAGVPEMKSIYERWHSRGFEVVGVSLDDTAAQAADDAGKRSLPWLQLHNGTCGSDLVGALGVRKIPSTVLLDREGRIVRLDVRGKALEEVLETLLR